MVISHPCISDIEDCQVEAPQEVFLENVAHILYMPEVWQVVLRTLCQEGYDTRWS